MQLQEEKVNVVAESEIVNNSESNIYNEEIVSSVKPDDFEMPTAMTNGDGEAHNKVRIYFFPFLLRWCLFYVFNVNTIILCINFDVSFMYILLFSV